MRKNIILFIFLYTLFSLTGITVSGQYKIAPSFNNTTHAVDATVFNLTTFSKKQGDYICNAVEDIHKRTYNSRYFVDRDTASKFFIVKASEAINYQKNRQWLVIDKKLSPIGKNIFEATNQQEPVGFDCSKQSSYIKTLCGIVYFNNWKLLGKNGTQEIILAKANWSHFTAGDDGIRISNIFPGIDAEMVVKKGAVKTNFIVRANFFNGYQQLFFTDEFLSAKQGNFFFEGRQNVNVESAGDVFLKIGQKPIAVVRKAVMYSENNPSDTYQYLSYKINNCRLAILINTNDLDTQLKNGNVIIDPLVSSVGVLPQINITGSMGNCSLPYKTCDYPLTMQTPAKATFTRIALQFGYTAYAPARLKDGAWQLSLGNCKQLGYFTIDPTAPDSIKNKAGNVSTFGNWADLPELIPCLPPPACIPQDVTFKLSFLNVRCDNSITGCSDVYISAEEPLQVLIEGRTLEMNTIVPPYTICQGKFVSLYATGIYGVPPYNYSWDNNGGKGDTVFVAPQTNTLYTVTVTDQCNNMVDSFTKVTVNPKPDFILFPKNSLCSGDTLIIKTKNTLFSNTLKEIDWYNNNQLKHSTLNNGGFIDTGYIPVTGGSYNTIITSKAGCADTTGILNIIQSVQPSITINITQSSVCAGSTVNFSAVTVNEGANPSYQWKLNGNNVGINNPTYSGSSFNNGDIINCTLISNASCAIPSSAISNVVVINITPIVTPAVSIIANNTMVCSGNPITFNATPINEGTHPSYQWKINGNNTGLDSNQFSYSSFANGDIVNCVITSNAACASTPAISNNIVVTVNPIIISTITIKSDTNNICSGTRVLFTASQTNGGASPSYQWQVDGHPVGGNSNLYSSDNLQNNSVVNCLLTSSLGCAVKSTSNNIIMTIYQLPQIKPGTDKIIQLGESVLLDMDVTGNISTYIWNPVNSLNDATIKEPLASPLTNTTYTLQVISSEKCKATADITVDVFTKIIMPNSFTPNGDGNNDFFRIPPSIPVQINAFMIFNRWGNKVFATSDSKQGWDGTYDGDAQPLGTYVWVIEYFNILTKKEEILKGAVVLIR